MLLHHYFHVLASHTGGSPSQHSVCVAPLWYCTRCTHVDQQKQKHDPTSPFLPPPLLVPGTAACLFLQYYQYNDDCYITKLVWYYYLYVLTISTPWRQVQGTSPIWPAQPDPPIRHSDDVWSDFLWLVIASTGYPRLLPTRSPMTFLPYQYTWYYSYYTWPQLTQFCHTNPTHVTPTPNDSWQLIYCNHRNHLAYKPSAGKIEKQKVRFSRTAHLWYFKAYYIYMRQYQVLLVYMCFLPSTTTHWMGIHLKYWVNCCCLSMKCTSLKLAVKNIGTVQFLQSGSMSILNLSKEGLKRGGAIGTKFFSFLCNRYQCEILNLGQSIENHTQELCIKVSSMTWITLNQSYAKLGTTAQSSYTIISTIASIIFYCLTYNIWQNKQHW